MIIRTDIKNVPPTRTQAAIRPPASNRNGYQATHIRNQNGPMLRKSLGDALSIAQVSQSLIQRVFAITFRLKSIATEALATGRINAGELDIALSDIRNTLGDFGESIPSPPLTSQGATVSIPEVPDISTEIRSVQDIAGDLKNGAAGVGDKIESLTKGLGEKYRDLKISEEGIIKMLGGPGPQTNKGAAGSEELLSRIKTDMNKNPGQALTIQGNILPGIAEKYTS